MMYVYMKIIYLSRFHFCTVYMTPLFMRHHWSLLHTCLWTILTMIRHICIQWCGGGTGRLDNHISYS